MPSEVRAAPAPAAAAVQRAICRVVLVAGDLQELRRGRRFLGLEAGTDGGRIHTACDAVLDAACAALQPGHEVRRGRRAPAGLHGALTRLTTAGTALFVALPAATRAREDLLRCGELAEDPRRRLGGTP